MGGSASVPGKVVIVGSGLAGVAVAKILDSKGVEVTLIDKLNGFSYYTIGALRGVVNEQVGQQVAVPLDNLLQHGKLVTGNVTNISDNTVTLESGETIPFDALIIATGSAAPFPSRAPDGAVTREQVGAAFRSTREAISRAKTVAIVGGGAVGYELAGEISDSFPGKGVHVFHAGKALLDGQFVPLDPRTQQRLLQSMEARGGVAHLDTRVDLNNLWRAIGEQGEDSLPFLDRTGDGKQPYVIQYDGDKELSADVVFIAVGNNKQAEGNALYNSEWWRTHASENPTRLKVNENLQVKGVEAGNIFCLGDAAFLAENQVGFLAQGEHATVTANNVRELLRSRADATHRPAFKIYTPATTTATGLFTYGSRGGAGQIGTSVVGERTTSMLKGRGLFLAKKYQQVNARLP